MTPLVSAAHRFTPPLWKTCRLQPLGPCDLAPSFHKSYPLSTSLLGRPVGDVGKTGLHASLSAMISKSPELHRRDLKNLSAHQVPTSQQLRRNFHFSCHNYGYYCLFIYLILLFPPFVAPSCEVLKSGLRSALVRSLNSACMLFRGESPLCRELPLFSTNRPSWR